jgi:hypothetical protein
MSYPSVPELLAALEAEPNQPGVLENTIDALLADLDVTDDQKATLRTLKDSVLRGSRSVQRLSELQAFLVSILTGLSRGAPLRRGLRLDIPPRRLDFDGGKRRSQTKKFGDCVKAVRKTVKARKGSNAESAAIAICTKTLLHPRGRTLKRYRKGRLLTQKRR